MVLCAPCAHVPPSQAAPMLLDASKLSTNSPSAAEFGTARCAPYGRLADASTHFVAASSHVFLTVHTLYAEVPSSTQPRGKRIPLLLVLDATTAVGSRAATNNKGNHIGPSVFNRMAV
eukprot:m.294136 g.294136  ORF g.294136 m.294136 type:complete len:118 (-) comp19501_c5_seq1:290-643(-)